jgi:hypothetical protein
LGPGGEGGGGVDAVQQRPSMHKALGLIPRTEKETGNLNRPLTEMMPNTIQRSNTFLHIKGFQYVYTNG